MSKQHRGVWNNINAEREHGAFKGEVIADGDKARLRGGPTLKVLKEMVVEGQTDKLDRLARWLETGNVTLYTTVEEGHKEGVEVDRQGLVAALKRFAEKLAMEEHSQKVLEENLLTTVALPHYSHWEKELKKAWENKHGSYRGLRERVEELARKLDAYKGREEPHNNKQQLSLQGSEIMVVGGIGVERLEERAYGGYYIKNRSDPSHGVDGVFLLQRDGLWIAAVSDGISSEARESRKAVLRENERLFNNLRGITREELEGKDDREIAQTLAEKLKSGKSVPVAAVEFYDRKRGMWRLFLYWGTDGGFVVKKDNRPLNPGLLDVKKALPHGYLVMPDNPAVLWPASYLGREGGMEVVMQERPAVFALSSTQPMEVAVYSDGVIEDLPAIPSSAAEAKEMVEKILRRWEDLANDDLSLVWLLPKANR